MDWCVKPPSEAPHQPVAIVDGDRTTAILDRSVKPGGCLTFDASASTAPDGAKLDFHWWIYQELSCGPLPQIDNPEAATTQVQFPEDCTGTHHCILELTQASEPPLKTYRRIRLNLEPADTAS